MLGLIGDPEVTQRKVGCWECMKCKGLCQCVAATFLLFSYLLWDSADKEFIMLLLMYESEAWLMSVLDSALEKKDKIK